MHGYAVRRELAVLGKVPLSRELGSNPRDRIGDGETLPCTKGTTVFPSRAIVDGGRPFMVGTIWALPPHGARGRGQDILWSEIAILGGVPLVRKIGKPLGEPRCM